MKPQPIKKIEVAVQLLAELLNQLFGAERLEHTYVIAKDNTGDLFILAVAVRNMIHGAKIPIYCEAYFVDPLTGNVEDRVLSESIALDVKTMLYTFE